MMKIWDVDPGVHEAANLCLDASKARMAATAQHRIGPRLDSELASQVAARRHHERLHPEPDRSIRDSANSLLKSARKAVADAVQTISVVCAQRQMGVGQHLVQLKRNAP
jgi:hypothetical protein